MLQRVSLLLGQKILSSEIATYCQGTYYKVQSILMIFHCQEKRILYSTVCVFFVDSVTKSDSQGEEMEIIVFQEHGSGEQKIKGVQKFGKDITITKIYSIDTFLPDFIEDPDNFINKNISADLILNYLKHPDLVDYLIALCQRKGIPVVSAGKKCAGFTPFTCCGLGKNKNLAHMEINLVFRSTKLL